MVPDLPILLLAAGQSRRMRGRDKLLEDVDGEPLLRRQARMACEVTDAPVLVALPPAPHPRDACVSDLPVEIVRVPDAAEGLNASLRRVFAAVPDTAEAALLFLADLPDLTANDLKSVLHTVDLKSENLVWRGATSDGKPGHPIVFARPLFSAFAGLEGDDGGHPVIARAKGRVVLVPLPGTRARLDLDTPEDWAAWRATRDPQPGKTSGTPGKALK
ncbi:nucleotidyltransferase family protein [uncultured Roseobacter sp.]|uniref:nucleotidyltransferase family protein n=1 Tax=uncultured Roseobacter sp. TaxID=114847 RepID=UPI002628D264|nr:nucleotidyltransferase family protein [uncultured Roseobacter sp.]